MAHGLANGVKQQGLKRYREVNLSFAKQHVLRVRNAPVHIMMLHITCFVFSRLPIVSSIRATTHNIYVFIFFLSAGT